VSERATFGAALLYSSPLRLLKRSIRLASNPF